MFATMKIGAFLYIGMYISIDPYSEKKFKYPKVEMCSYSIEDI